MEEVLNDCKTVFWDLISHTIRSTVLGGASPYFMLCILFYVYCISINIEIYGNIARFDIDIDINNILGDIENQY
jgi:hypothetical protein